MKNPAYRNIFLLTGSQAISQFGSSLTNIALVFWIKERFESGTALGMFYLAATLSAALVSLVAGPLIDRWPKIRMLIFTDLASAVIMALFAAVLFFLKANTWALVVVFGGKILLSLMYGVRQPTIGAAIFEVTEMDQRQRSNSIFSSGRQMAMVLSESISGVVYSLLALPMVLTLDLVTYLIAAIMVGMISRGVAFRLERPQIKDKLKAGFFHSTLEGWRFVREQRGLLALALSVLVINVFFAPFVVWTPFLVGDVLHLAPSWFGYTTCAISLGILLGSNSSWIPAFNNDHRRVYFLILFGLGSVFLGIGLVKSAPLILALYAAMGIFTGAFNVKLMSIVQGCIRPEFHGRVFSVLFGIGFLLGPVAKALSGMLIDMLNKRADWLFAGSGLCLIATALILSKIGPLNELLNAKQELSRAA